MIQKIFVTREKKANFTCPECGKTKLMDVSRYADIKSSVKLKAKCICGHHYSVLLERRQHIRKPVNFPGFVIQGKKREPVFVLNISQSGMMLKGKFAKQIQSGERLLVRFNLDDEQSSEVEKEVVVRNVMPPLVGVEFVSHTHYGRLGNYLLYGS